MSGLRVQINHETTCQDRSPKDKAKTNFHGVCVNIKQSLDGISDEEIEKIWSQVMCDVNDGLVIAATMGIEWANGTRHLHVSMILSHPTLSNVTWKRYVALIEPGRVDFTKPDSRGVKKCVTVQVAQPGKGKREHYTAYRWLAYSHKEKAKEFNDVDTFVRDMNVNDSTKFKSIGTYDGTDDDEERKMHLGMVIFTSWQKKIIRGNATSETIYINDSLGVKAMRFMETTGMRVAWNPENLTEKAENQAKVITAMVLNRVGKKRYQLDGNFFGKKNNEKLLVKNLALKKPLPGHTNKRYEQELYNAINQRVAKVLGVSICSKQEAALSLSHQKLLKKVERLETVCKQHVVKYEKLKSRTRNRGVKELLALQATEDRYQDHKERESRDYCRAEFSADMHTRRIPKVERMDFEFLVKDVSASDISDVLRVAESPQISGTKRRRGEETHERGVDE